MKTVAWRLPFKEYEGAHIEYMFDDDTQHNYKTGKPIKGAGKAYLESRAKDCFELDESMVWKGEAEPLMVKPDEQEIRKRLQDAIEGECDGLSVTDEVADKILDYMFHPEKYV